MDGSLAAYLPQDRRQALAQGADLPEHTHGAALFADISGFTPLTDWNCTSPTAASKRSYQRIL